jgi:hypothetical protein
VEIVFPRQTVNKQELLESCTCTSISTGDVSGSSFVTSSEGCSAPSELRLVQNGGRWRHVEILVEVLLLWVLPVGFILFLPLQCLLPIVFWATISLGCHLSQLLSHRSFPLGQYAQSHNKIFFQPLTNLLNTCLKPFLLLDMLASTLGNCLVQKAKS